MGHTRLGTIPKSAKWNTVVAQLVGTDNGSPDSTDVAQIAAQTLDAARTGLEQAIGDTGLGYTFYLLTQIVLASRQSDWLDRLAGLGLNLSNDSTLFDLTAEVQYAIDDHIRRNGHSTDVSEMAQRAAGQALALLAGTSSVTLFGSGNDELRAVVRHLSTRNGFAQLGQVFFGQFTTRFLNFYLSRIAAAQVGRGQLQGIADLTSFNRSLEVHCEQTARIVRDFCGQWYSKTEYVEGIDLRNTSRFMAVALKKLRNELLRQRDEL